MAHIDFPRRYFDNWNVSDTIMDEILNAMIKKDIILEVNTSSIMNASDEPLPRYSIIDRYALRELVSAIYVDAPDKSSGKRVQHIHIKYDGLGYIPLDELEAKEKA